MIISLSYIINSVLDVIYSFALWMWIIIESFNDLSCKKTNTYSHLYVWAIIHCVFLATSSLYTDFKHCLQKNESESDVFDLLASYEEICADHEVLLKKLTAAARPDLTWAQVFISFQGS